MFFFYNVLLIMCKFTGNTTTPPVTVVCYRASAITMTVTMASTSVGLATFGWYDVVLPLEMIQWDRMRGYVGLTIVPQQQ